MSATNSRFTVAALLGRQLQKGVQRNFVCPCVGLVEKCPLGRLNVAITCVEGHEVEAFWVQAITYPGSAWCEVEADMYLFYINDKLAIVFRAGRLTWILEDAKSSFGTICSN